MKVCLKLTLLLRSEQTSIQAIYTFQFNIQDLDTDLMPVVKKPFSFREAWLIFFKSKLYNEFRQIIEP